MLNIFSNIINQLQPSVYRIVGYNGSNNNINYKLEYISSKFTVPEKIYGDIPQNAVRIWNDYALGEKSTGCLLLGDKGTGKTLLGTLISNIAIDNKIPVILVTEIKPTIELIQFLNQLKNCVLLLDEFVKNIPYEYQSVMLTMFSDLFNTRKLFIITENSDRSIQDYILDRPGRIKYRLDFDKLSRKTFDEYTHCFIKDKKFLKDLDEIYRDALEFSFDQLSTIVKEHLNYPNENINDLIEILNVKSLRRKKYIRIKRIIDKNNPETKYTHTILGDTEVGLFKSSFRGIFVEIRDEKTRNLVLEFNLKYNDLKQLDNNDFIYKIDNYEIFLEYYY